MKPEGWITNAFKVDMSKAFPSESSEQKSSLQASDVQQLSQV